MRDSISNLLNTKKNIEEYKLAKRRSQAPRMTQIQQKMTLLLSKPIASTAFGFGC